MLALYILTLTASAGIVGIFVREVLGSLGMVANFDTGILLAGGVASLYLVVQLAYMTLLRFLFPTGTGAMYFAESLSHCAAAMLVPYLVHLEVSWPHPALERAQAILYFGAFGMIHVFFKLTSFYAALRGQAARRGPGFAWAIGAAAAAVAALISLTNWIEATEQARPNIEEEAEWRQVGDAYAAARVIPEGSRLAFDLEPVDGQTLTLRWAPLPEPSSAADAVDIVNVTVELEGDVTKDFAVAARLSPDGWVETRVPPDAFPANVQRARVRWARQELSSWQRILRLEPVVYGPAPGSEGDEESVPAKVLVSGPYLHQVRQETTPMNFVVIAIDGLGANHTTLGGYSREATPHLTRFAAISSAYTQAFTPAPDSEAALTSLLTGLHPLEHGVWTSRPSADIFSHTTLASLLRDLSYATVAFTEGDADNIADLYLGRGFESGFELFDPAYAPPIEIPEEGQAPPLEGSAITIEKARAWIGEHQDLKFFAFLRIRELMDPGPAERYGEPYAEIENARPEDLYDAVVTYVDARLGSLLSFIKDYEIRRNTCVIITGTHGVDFTGSETSFELIEPVLHVPLVLYMPGQEKARYVHRISHYDIPATIAVLAGTALPAGAEGRNFLGGSIPNSPVAMSLTPEVFSIRGENYRYTWQPRGVGAEKYTGLFRVSNRAGWWRTDVSSRSTDIAERYQNELKLFIEKYTQ